MVGGPSRPIPNRVATLVAGWSLGYVLFGASPAGHDWYGTVSCAGILLYGQRVFFDDDDAEDWGTAAKKGRIVDVSPSKSVEFAPLDDGSESEGSFDSANLTDDEDIEEESEDDDSIESDADDYLC